MDRRVWWATVQGVSKSQTWLSRHTTTAGKNTVISDLRGKNRVFQVSLKVQNTCLHSKSSEKSKCKETPLTLSKGLWAGGEGDDRGWDGWMASLTWWTWVWANSRSWWWTGRPGVLRFMGLQRVGHDWATKLNWTEHKFACYSLHPSHPLPSSPQSVVPVQYCINYWGTILRIMLFNSFIPFIVIMLNKILAIFHMLYNIAL